MANGHASNTPDSHEEPIEEPVVTTDPADDDPDEDEEEVAETTPAPRVASPAPAAAAATEDDPDFGKLTPRERALIQKARSQEKTKLYTELNAAKERIRTLTEQRPQQPAGTTRRQQTDDQLSRLETQVGELTNHLRKRDIRDYRTKQIEDLRRRGVNFIEALVTGDSEELIDASISLAVAEAELKEHEFRVKHGISEDTPGNGNPAPTPTPRRPGRTVVIQRERPARPENVPAVPGAGVSGDSSDHLTTAQMNALTSMDAVRDGTYAANRDRIFRALRSGAVRD